MKFFPNNIRFFRFDFVLCVFFLLLFNSCMSHRSQEQNLILKGTISEESPRLDPQFLARRNQAEQNFFGNSSPGSHEQEQASDEDEEELQNSDQTNISEAVPKNFKRNSFSSFAILWPASGKLTSIFGMRSLRRHRRMHSGIDIGAPVGTPIHASANGQVLFAGRKRGYGKAVIVGHDSNHETLYGHMSRMIVHEGQYVKRHQVIGYVGRTGRTTGANLHYETRINGTAYNPLFFLPPTSNGKMKRGMLTPTYAEQLSYYARVDKYAYQQKKPAKKFHHGA